MLVAIAPIFRRDFPLLVGIVLAVVETIELFLGAYRNPEFQQQRAPCLKLALEFVDFVVGATPFRGAREPFNTLDKHAAIPAAVVDSHMAGTRQARPVAPQVRMDKLDFRGRGAGENGVRARVDSLRHALDIAALASRIIAFVQNHERNAGQIHLQLKLGEALLLALERFLIFFPGQRERMVDIGQARRVLHDGETRMQRRLFGLFGSLRTGGGHHAFGLFGRAVARIDLFKGTGAVGGRLRSGGFGGGIGAARKRALQGAHERFSNCDVRRTLVFAVDHGPTREIEIGIAQKLIVARVNLVVVFHGGELFVAHAPRGIGVVAKALQALLLHVLRYVHEEFQHHVTIGGKLSLEFAHGAPVGLQVGRMIRFGIGVDQTACGRRVPPAFVQRHVAAGAKRLPELLHERLEAGNARAHVAETGRAFLVEIRQHMHVRRARVEFVDQIADAASLARAVPAFEQGNDAHTLLAGLLLQHYEFRNKFVVQGFVFLFRHFRRKINLFQHMNPLSHCALAQLCANVARTRDGNGHFVQLFTRRCGLGVTFFTRPLAPRKAPFAKSVQSLGFVQIHSICLSV